MADADDLSGSASVVSGSDAVLGSAPGAPCSDEATLGMDDADDSTLPALPSETDSSALWFPVEDADESTDAEPSEEAGAELSDEELSTDQECSSEDVCREDTLSGENSLGAIEEEDDVSDCTTTCSNPSGRISRGSRSECQVNSMSRSGCVQTVSTWYREQL